MNLIAESGRAKDLLKGLNGVRSNLTNLLDDLDDGEEQGVSDADSDATDDELYDENEAEEEAVALAGGRSDTVYVVSFNPSEPLGIELEERRRRQAPAAPGATNGGAGGAKLRSADRVLATAGGGHGGGAVSKRGPQRDRLTEGAGLLVCAGSVWLPSAAAEQRSDERDRVLRTPGGCGCCCVVPFIASRL